jgi:FkbM family methyltransferase
MFVFPNDKLHLLPITLSEGLNNAFFGVLGDDVLKPKIDDVNVLADVCRDVALAYEADDLILAKKFMELAHSYRNTGLFIKQKLKEYNLFYDVLDKGSVVIDGAEFVFGDTPPYALLKALANGSYERDEARLLKEFISESDTVLELGSGIGFMGVLAQKYIKCREYVAFEANPNLIAVIKKNMQQNEVSFDIRNAVLMNESGKVNFYITPAFWASSLIKPVSGQYVLASIPAVDKNEVINEIKPTALVIDIEGGEVEFFKGLNLSTVNKIVLEMHPQVLEDVQLSELYETLLAEGFILNFKESFKNVNYWYRAN